MTNREKKVLEQRPGSKEKEKVYVAPKLVGYGDFRRLTQAKGSVQKDNVGAQLKCRTQGEA